MSHSKMTPRLEKFLRALSANADGSPIRTKGFHLSFWEQEITSKFYGFVYPENFSEISF